MSLPSFLFALVILTGLARLCERFWLGPRRAARVSQGLADFDARASAPGASLDPQERDLLKARLSERSAWIEQASFLFPVMACVFFARSFIFEPYKIPSGSMIPTLQIGDFILVSKYAYGERLPILNTKLFDTGSPKRGDTMVFRYPLDESQNYIKRVIGEPGDVVSYRSKRLFINGAPALYAPDLSSAASEPGHQRFIETLPGGVAHRVQLDTSAPPMGPGSGSFNGQQACSFFIDGFECRVPAGRYFMMGDNRDHSADSRYWGFVSDRQIVGQARWVWLNLSDLGRIGPFEIAPSPAR